MTHHPLPLARRQRRNPAQEIASADISGRHLSQAAALADPWLARRLRHLADGPLVLARTLRRVIARLPAEVPYV